MLSLQSHRFAAASFRFRGCFSHLDFPEGVSVTLDPRPETDIVDTYLQSFGSFFLCCC